MSEAWIGVIAAAITGLLSLIGVWISNRKGQTLIAYRIDQLEKTVNKHNQVADKVDELKSRIIVIEHDMQNLKSEIK